MKFEFMKTAIIFLTHKCNEEIVRQIRKLQDEANLFGDIFVCYQSDKCVLDKSINVNTFPFSLEELNELNYNSWGHTLMNGNSHLILLYFFKKKNDYDFYWMIEYDVRFNGHWATFFSYFADKLTDFVSAHIGTYADEPKWTHWYDMKSSDIPLNNKTLRKSFDPIFRVSKKAVLALQKRCELGDTGHFEVLMPTVFKYNNLGILDFGGEGRYSVKDMFYKEYLSGDYAEKTFTHRFRPTYMENEMIIPNMIYHPIK